MEAIRDLEYMNRLQEIDRTKAWKFGTFLESNFADISAGLRSFRTTWLTFPDEGNEQRVNAVRRFLQRILPAWISFSGEGIRKSEYSYFRQPVYPKSVDRLANFVIATVLAVGGGASLIVPMVVMALNPSLTKSLITTSVAVVLFALVFALVDRKIVMTLTTAYAAVLVVFVGTSGTT